MSPQQPSSSSLPLDRALPILQRENLVLKCSDAFALPKNFSKISTDSRKIEIGGVFLAYKGVSSDGHLHIATASQRGAALLIIEDPSKLPSGCKTPWIQVTNGRSAWAFLEAEACGNPQDDIDILAITGTNGKTSTAWMIHAMLKAAGVPSLLIGTLGAWVGDSFRKTNHTTPDPDLLYALFAEAKTLGIKYAVMEAASQSLIHGKLAPIKFAAAAFTSFSRDHLDLHGSMEEYFAAKWSLFTRNLRQDARVAISAGVPVGDRFSELRTKDIWVYKCVGSNTSLLEASLRKLGAGKFRQCEVADSSPNGTSLTLQDIHGSDPAKRNLQAGVIPYFGDFFVENFCAATLLVEHALNKELASNLWENLPPVPGRLETVVRPVGSKTLPHTLVDYAHTPDALEKALVAVRAITKGKLIVVFGCGGDRDRGKRPQMGATAFKYADRAFVTSDNPRTEDPNEILNDIVRGAMAENFEVVPDRKTAIERAIASAAFGDVVLIAGKGHEDYQIVGTVSHPFDDRLVGKHAMIQQEKIRSGKA